MKWLLLLFPLSCIAATLNFTSISVGTAKVGTITNAPAAGGGLTGAPAFSNASSSNTLSATTLQWSLYVDATNANKIALVGLEWYQASSPTRYGPTIGGSGNVMTLIGTTNLYDSGGHVDLYYYIAPAAGTLNISNGWSGTVGEISGFAMLVTNAPQTSAFETVALYSSSTGTPQSFTNTVTSTTSELIVDVFGHIEPGNSYVTQGTNQTDRVQGNSGTGHSGGGMSTAIGINTSTEIGWASTGGTVSMADVAIAVKQ